MNRIVSRTFFKRSLLILGAVIFLFGALSTLHSFRRSVRTVTQTTLAHVSSDVHTPFPAVSNVGLTPLRQKIVALNREEYVKKPVSYDSTVLKYTQSSKEPWCADYVSWIYEQAGIPFNNQYSGSWRIPGVYTLQEYFQSTDHYVEAGRYIPQPGDVAIYTKGQGHTNIVLAVKNGTMTTIGGNENGRLRINTQALSPGSEGLVGFGTPLE